MTSWRDTASTQAQADLDGLLQPAIGFAQQRLDERGEFYPYAVVVTTAGEQEMVTATMPAEQPESRSVIHEITRTLTAQREGFRAVAIVADIRVSELATDAIRVTLEHREGPVMSVVLPYARRKFRGGYVFGQLQGTTAHPSVW